MTSVKSNIEGAGVEIRRGRGNLNHISSSSGNLHRKCLLAIFNYVQNRPGYICVYIISDWVINISEQTLATHDQ